MKSLALLFVSLLPSFQCLDLARLYEQYNKREGNMLGNCKLKQIDFPKIEVKIEFDFSRSQM